MRIGGLFPLEDAPSPADDASRSVGERVFFPEGGDTRFCMSGRCALYYALLDLLENKPSVKRAAYVPAYTCETVLAPYKKAGFDLCFYDVDPDGLVPRFLPGLIPRIGVLALCGYYGFSYYDRAFIKECSGAGVSIVHDVTHSVFSEDGIEPLADYTAGSLRKWLGIPSGGFAVKRRGSFSSPLLPPEEPHVKGRFACFAERERVIRGNAGATEDTVSALFWDTELRLRRVFDAYAGDERSAAIMKNYPYSRLIAQRRRNYETLLAKARFSPRATPVYPRLDSGVCPSHLALYAEDRDAAVARLSVQGISATVYWPFHQECGLADFPGAAYIYGHIYSVPMDQRYTDDNMRFLADTL